MSPGTGSSRRPRGWRPPARVDQFDQAAREFLQVRLGEMAVERLAVGPLLDGDEAERILHGREEPVAQAPLLAAGVVLHLPHQRDELVPLLGPAPDPADHQQHGWDSYSYVRRAPAASATRAPSGAAP